MGLDMYLTREKDLGELKRGEKKGRLILREHVGYWRKFYALHKYMRENFGGEEDNCVPMALSIEDLRLLLGRLLELKKRMKLDKEGGVANKEVCEELLPSEDGLRSSRMDDYDRYYVKDVDNTISMLRQLIEEDNGDCEYSYLAWY